MSYLYSKLPETGVPPHIGTGGARMAMIAGLIGHDPADIELVKHHFWIGLGRAAVQILTIMREAMHSG